MCLNIKDYFLATPMAGTEYVRVKYKYILQDIRLRYNIDKIIAKDDWIYIEIGKGMPALKQAAILAY